MTMNDSNKAAVGFVGAGLMGHGMAKHVLLGGHPLTVIANRNREPIEDLVEQGAHEASSLAELAGRSEVIILCVSNSDVVEHVVFGENGLLAGAAEGTVFVDSGTSRPAASVAVNARLRAAGMLYADAPLSRSPAKAEEGAVVTFASCEAALMERLTPLFECYSEHVFHVAEEVGKAHQLKLINNFISAAYVASWAEAYNACLAAGIEPKALHEVVSSAGMNCLNFQNYSKFVLEHDPSGHKFAIENMHKDLRYHAELAAALGVSTAVADPVRQLFALAESRGYGKDFATVMPKVVGEINNKPAGELPRG